jgi:broad specificity phosphatase PhoE
MAALLALGRQWPGGEVLAVSHGGVIRVLRRFLGAVDIPITNLSGCWFTVHERDLTVDPDVVTLIEPDEAAAPGPAQAAESETDATADAERL